MTGCGGAFLNWCQLVLCDTLALSCMMSMCQVGSFGQDGICGMFCRLVLRSSAPSITCGLCTLQYANRTLVQATLHAGVPLPSFLAVYRCLDKGHMVGGGTQTSKSAPCGGC